MDQDLFPHDTPGGVSRGVDGRDKPIKIKIMAFGDGRLDVSGSLAQSLIFQPCARFRRKIGVDPFDARRPAAPLLAHRSSPRRFPPTR